MTTKSKKTVLTRRNKNYTSIFITDFSDETLQEAFDIHANEQYSVIKLKQSAVDDYIERYNPIEKMRKAKESEVGYQFEIAGYYFTKIELDNFDNCYLTLRDETDYKNGSVLHDFGTFGRKDILINIIFHHKEKELTNF